MNTQLLKHIVMNGNIATFSHTVDGKRYYKVITENTTYEFYVDLNDTEDIGDTIFPDECKAVTLMRYIRKAIKNEELVLF